MPPADAPPAGVWSAGPRNKLIRRLDKPAVQLYGKKIVRDWDRDGDFVMDRAKLGQMRLDDLWSLHVEIRQILRQRIQQKKVLLEERLTRLRTPVHPKYRNPDHPSEAWTGRGRQPRWLVAQLKSGKRIDDFRVQVRKRRPV